MLYRAMLSCKSMLFRSFCLFPTSSILCIENWSPRVRVSIENSTATFWGLWGRTFGESDRVRDARRIGFFHDTHSWVSSQNQHCIASVRVLFARFSTRGLLFLPKLQPKRWRYPERIAESLRFARTDKEFQGGFKKWQGRWNQCIAAKGNYFENNDFKRNYISFVFKHNWFGNFWIPSRIIE